MPSVVEAPLKYRPTPAAFRLSFAGMTPEELATVYDAIAAAGAGWLAIYNQPRMADGIASDFVADEMDRCHAMADEIASMACQNWPDGEGREEYRLRVLRRHSVGDPELDLELAAALTDRHRLARVEPESGCS
ncbi:hypothetical protein [Bauldia litoralis]|uniref:hypothetical protein n=1 Tax=Bauldia litoralis TaxID=665467 RepID=UPI00326617E2